MIGERHTVDTQGSTTLIVPVSQLITPTLDRHQLRTLRRAGDSAFDAWCPNHYGEWTHVQLVRLAVAAILESRLLNTARDSFGAFQLSGHPEDTTLHQLALLNRPHHGLAGQAFEIAVADACNAGVPEVVQPIASALQDLGIRDLSPIRMLLLGLEKVAPAQKQMFYKTLYDALPANTALRSGGPGAPMSMSTMLDRMSKMTWRSVSGRSARPEADPSSPEARWASSQMGRADAIVFGEKYAVLASLKINPRHLDRSGWKHVPLWITIGDHDPRATTAARCPTSVAALPPNGMVMAAFREAIMIVDEVFRRLGRVQPVSVGTMSSRRDVADAGLLRALLNRKDQHVAEILEDLRRATHPAVIEAAGGSLAVADNTVRVPVLQNPGIRRAWTNAGRAGDVFAAQPHLFLRAA